MIIKNQRDVTPAVLSELERARIRAQGNHGRGGGGICTNSCARTDREAEFQQACAYIATLGKLTTESHNEVVLIAGSLGVSSLVCLLNNGDHGQTETTANLLGPFWRMNSPRTANGESIVRSPTPSDPIFVNAWVRDQQGRPVVGAEVDVAYVGGGHLRESGSGASRHEPSRQVHDRQGRTYQLPQRQAGRLSDPDQRPRRRAAARAGPPQHAAGARAFPHLQARLQNAILAVYSSDDPNLERESSRVTRAHRQYGRHENGRPPARTSRDRGIRAITTS